MSGERQSVRAVPKKRARILPGNQESVRIRPISPPLSPSSPTYSQISPTYSPLSPSSEEDDTPSPPKRGRSPVIEKVYKFKGSWKTPQGYYKIKEGTEHIGSPYYKVDGCPGLEYNIFTKYIGTSRIVSARLNLLQPKNHTVQADYTITIPSAGFSKKVSHLYTEEFGSSSVNIFNSAALSKPFQQYFKDGWMEIVVEGTFKLIPKEKKPLFTVDLTTVKEEFYAAEYSLPADVLIVEGKRIKVHKLLLPQKFSNINATFNSDAGEFEINDYPYEIARVAVAFAHDRPLPKFKVQELIQLSKFVQQYGYDDLKSTIDLTFADMIDQSNIHELAALSITMDAPELKQLCMTYLFNARRSENPNNINLNTLIETFLNEFFTAMASGSLQSAAASSTTMNTSNGPNARVKPEPVETSMVAASDVPNT